MSLEQSYSSDKKLSIRDLNIATGSTDSRNENRLYSKNSSKKMI